MSNCPFGVSPVNYPDPDQRSELNHTILCNFGRGNQRIREGIPVPNSLREEAAFISICASNGSLKCHRVLISTTPSFGDKVVCWYVAYMCRPRLIVSAIECWFLPRLVLDKVVCWHVSYMCRPRLIVNAVWKTVYIQVRYMVLDSNLGSETTDDGSWFRIWMILGKKEYRSTFTVDCAIGIFQWFVTFILHCCWILHHWLFAV